MNKFKNSSGRTIPKALTIGLVVLLVALGLVLFFYLNDDNEQNNITSFEECVAAGNAILETDPRQCRAEDGTLFTETKTQAGEETEDGQTDDGETDDDQAQDDSNVYVSENGVEITVNNPQDNETISSPLEVEGMVPGNWSFEANFPVKLYDGNNQLIESSFATLQGDWMTEQDVPFTATIEFTPPETSDGFLVLEKSNPSGLPENEDSVTIPIQF